MVFKWTTRLGVRIGVRSASRITTGCKLSSWQRPLTNVGLQLLDFGCKVLSGTEIKRSTGTSWVAYCDRFHLTQAWTEDRKTLGEA